MPRPLLSILRNNHTHGFVPLLKTFPSDSEVTQGLGRLWHLEKQNKTKKAKANKQRKNQSKTKES